MPVAPVSRKAVLSASLVNMLANCAAFQAAVGAATRSAARAFIVEEYGGKKTFLNVDGTSIDPEQTFAITRMGQFTPERRANDTYGWQAEADLILTIRTTAGDSPADTMRRAANLQDTVQAQLEAQWMLTTPFVAPVAGLITPGEIYLADDTRANRLHLVAPIALTIFDL